MILAPATQLKITHESPRQRFRLAEREQVAPGQLLGSRPSRSTATRRWNSYGKKRSSRPPSTVVGTSGQPLRPYAVANSESAGARLRGNSSSATSGGRSCRK